MGPRGSDLWRILKKKDVGAKNLRLELAKYVHKRMNKLITRAGPEYLNTKLYLLVNVRIWILKTHFVIDITSVLLFLLKKLHKFDIRFTNSSRKYRYLSILLLDSFSK